MSLDYCDSQSSKPRKKLEKPPFKLCFSRHTQNGRSDACVSKTNANFITPKFYSHEIENVQNSTNVEEIVEKLTKEENSDPKECYRWPLLTSHTYGWWHEKGIRPKDPRFNFHKKTSDLVTFQMKIYAEDRKLQNVH